MRGMSTFPFPSQRKPHHTTRKTGACGAKALHPGLRKGHKTSTHAGHEAPEVVGCVHIREHCFELVGRKDRNAFRHTVDTIIVDIDGDHEGALGVFSGYLLAQAGTSASRIDKAHVTNSLHTYVVGLNGANTQTNSCSCA